MTDKVSWKIYAAHSTFIFNNEEDAKTAYDLATTLTNGIVTLDKLTTPEPIMVVERILPQPKKNTVANEYNIPDHMVEHWKKYHSTRGVYIIIRNNMFDTWNECWDHFLRISMELARNSSEVTLLKYHPKTDQYQKYNSPFESWVTL